MYIYSQENVNFNVNKLFFSGPEFLFGQSEQGEDFQFAFNFQSPGETSKDKNKEDFVFPFNF